MAQRPMTPQQLEAELRRRTQQGEVQDVVKVLVLGNSGTGKSFLLNCLLGGNVFEHDYQPGSCTAENSFALHVAGNTAYVLCNVPGLLEADQQNIARNQSCIEAGFQMLPDALTVVAFVIDLATGGRLQADDVEAYKSVASYVPALQAASTAVIANGMRKFRADEAAKRASYQTSTTAMVKQLMEREVSVHYIERLDNCEDFNSPPVKEAGSIFEAAIASLTPAPVQPQQGARLELDRKSKAEELKAMKAMIVQLEEQHATAMRQMTEAWQQQMRQFQESMQAQIKAVQEAASRRQRRGFTIGLGPLSFSFG